MVKTVTLEGSAAGTVIAKTGHGLMGMHLLPNLPYDDEHCFAAIIAGIERLPPGVKMFLNSGEFYDFEQGTRNVEMLGRFFAKYPQYADKTFLSVKGGLVPRGFQPDGSPENIRRSVDNILSCLGGHKRLDLFQCARVDPKITIEDNMKTLKALQAEGKFDHVGLSETKAETVRRANAVVPVVAVEVEISPWAYEVEAKELIPTCKELGIAIIAYSPLGHGFLTGTFKKREDIPNDWRAGLTRLKAENLQHNLVLVDALAAIAAKKGVTNAALCLAWVASLGPHIVLLPGSSSASRILENIAGGDVDLTAEEKREVDAVVESFEAKGGRYFDAPDSALHLWS